MSEYRIHITSAHKWWDLKLQEVWQYRDLIGLFTRRTFAVTYKQTILGPAWFFLKRKTAPEPVEGVLFP